MTQYQKRGFPVKPVGFKKGMSKTRIAMEVEAHLSLKFDARQQTHPASCAESIMQRYCGF